MVTPKVNTTGMNNQKNSNKIIIFITLNFLIAFVCYRQQNLESRSTVTALSTTISTVVDDYELKRETINSQDVLYQLPPVNKIEEINGILFVAHGCQHSMTDWWSTSSICNECIGLPEEKAIVDIARMKISMIVMSMSSSDRNRKCWSSTDGPLVASVMIEIQNRFSSSKQTIPLFAFGASSGGYFVSSILPKSLSEKGKLDGYICQISSPPNVGSDESYKIPSVFITMDRDKSTDKRVNKYEATMGNSIPVKHIRLSPLKMIPSFFTDRISKDKYSTEISTNMIQSLIDANYIDKEKLLLIDNPRNSNWRSILQAHVLSSESGDSLIADLSPLSEIMNVAYSQHEMSRDGVFDGLEFLLHEYASIKNSFRELSDTSFE